ncbi:MAG TPA: polysaccharide biosynthesis tyrosine autokinase [Anaerolineales bacterium]|nr:polysaccharide biosynthesis tyrosine autokinase [Anaerolineales bacterium]
MELKRIIVPLKRWWWLITIATLLAAISSFLATLRQPSVYQASTILIVGRAIMDPNPSNNEFFLGQQLAANYAEIAKRDPVRNATKQALGLAWLPNYVARVTPNSQFIEIAVTDTIPARAQAVANELARQLILRGPTSTQAEEQDRREFVNRQLDALEQQIENTETEIATLQAELGDMVSARQIADAQNQLAALQIKLTTLQGNYANLLANTESGALNTLTIIEKAPLPVKPIGPDRLLTALLAAAIGFALSSGAAYLIEYLDDTLKTRDDIERVIQAPIIGFLAEVDKHEEDSQRLYVAENPRHPIVESYRSLRTNLEFSAVDKPLKTILVASSEPEDGKSSVAANLAVIITQGEKKVILVDADMRKPNLHTFFNLPNDSGLSDIFRGRLTIEEAIKGWRGENIAILTAGAPPPNPTELLGSKRMNDILEKLQKMADLVIIDGPPFIVADATVLSAKVDGVLMVVRSGHTHEAAARGMMEQVQRAGASIVGVVLNRIPHRGSRYYDGNRHYADYYSNRSYFEADEPRKKKEARKSVEHWNGVDKNLGYDIAKVTCPRCQQTTRQNKAGKTTSASQRYRCMHCGHKYTPNPKLHGYPDDLRRQALQLYLDGMNLRRIGRRLGIHHRTISLWVKANADSLLQEPLPDEATTAEMDGLFTFIGDKNTGSKS